MFKMFKFFKKKKRFPEDYPPIEELWQKTGHGLVKVVCHSAFKIFKNKDFRELTGFEALDQTEQDRIFNELEVTALCLLIFLLDDYIKLAKNDDPAKEQVFSNVRDAIKPEFLKMYKDLKIEQKCLNTWGKLIDLRLEEYKKDIPEIEKAFRQLKESFKDKKVELFERRTGIMAAGGHTHICRGRTEGRDKLYLLIRRWLRNLDSKLCLPFDKGLKKKVKI